VDVEARIGLIRDLCSFEGRLAGTDAERRAANWLAGRLRSMGRRADVEPTYVHPQVALVHAAHCAIGFAGSLAAIASPPVGFGLVLLAAVATYLDLNGRLYLLRRLFYRRASQNVVSPGPRPEAPARLILSAHYDVPRSGWLFGPARVRAGERLGRLLGVPLGPYRVIFWSLAVLLPILGARLAGVGGAGLSLVQLIPTLILLVGAFVLAEIQLSGPVPGANGNASGVATALALVESLADTPPRALDVWVVLAGGEGCLMEGMRAFARAHRRDLEPATTFFVNLDSVGAGELRYVKSEGLAVGFEMDRRVVELCGAIAAAAAEDGDANASEPLAWGIAGDGLPLRLARYPGTTITATAPGASVAVDYRRPTDVPDSIDAAALDRAHAFSLELVRQLDREAGRRAERATGPTPERPEAAVI
jgi:peptidase M28-like protein